MGLVEFADASYSALKRITRIHGKEATALGRAATYAEVMEIRPDTIRVIIQEIPERIGQCPGSRLPIPAKMNLVEVELHKLALQRRSLHDDEAYLKTWKD